VPTPQGASDSLKAIHNYKLLTREHF